MSNEEQLTGNFLIRESWLSDEVYLKKNQGATDGQTINLNLVELNELKIWLNEHLVEKTTRVIEWNNGVNW